MAHVLPAGTPAPEFTLHVTPRRQLSLKELRGQPVVLAFCPVDRSPSMRAPNGPTFFSNGVRHDADFEYETLLAAVSEAIG